MFKDDEFTEQEIEILVNNTKYKLDNGVIDIGLPRIDNLSYEELKKKINPLNKHFEFFTAYFYAFTATCIGIMESKNINEKNYKKIINDMHEDFAFLLEYARILISVPTDKDKSTRDKLNSYIVSVSGTILCLADAIEFLNNKIEDFQFSDIKDELDVVFWNARDQLRIASNIYYGDKRTFSVKAGELSIVMSYTNGNLDIKEKYNKNTNKKVKISEKDLDEWFKSL